MKNENTKVMIVDDDKFLLDMYVMKFKKMGFEVVACVGGEECLNRLKEGETTDIFVFDLIMPKIDGTALAEEIHKNNYIPNATKIILSNQGQASDIEKFKGKDVDGYIVKALHTPSEVAQKVIEIDKAKKSSATK